MSDKEKGKKVPTQSNGVVHPSRPSLSNSGEFYDIAFKVRDELNTRTASNNANIMLYGKPFTHLFRHVFLLLVAYFLYLAYAQVVSVHSIFEFN